MAASDRTHYDVLGISPDADAQQVRAAWKLHVQAWHPDRFTGEMREEAERQATRINEAYAVLRDDSRRAAYDCRLAAERAAAETERAPRRAAKATPSMPRPAATPVGTPMAYAEPQTLGEQAAAMGRDALQLMRRHPRWTAVAVSVWVVVFGGSAVMHAVSGPSLPASANASTKVAAAHVVDDQQVEDLEDLAEEARAEAARAERELAAQLARDEAAAIAAEQAAAAQAERAARAAAAAAKRRPRANDPRAGAALAPRAPQGAPQGAQTTPDGRRIVRVMPDTV